MSSASGCRLGEIFAYALAPVALFRSSPLDPEIRRLALPALGALVAEPLFLLTDTALVGHLGSTPLAGLSIASAIIQTVLGLLIFLAYTTTPAVARALGAGDMQGALRHGIAGMWLAVLLGTLLAAAGIPAAGWASSLFGATAEVTGAATTYLTISLLGLPGMLLAFAATGLLRGLQDTRTPLVVSLAGFLSNALLNVLFIYGFGWGLAGSAAGTAVASWGMAIAYIVVVVHAVRRHHAPVLPNRSGLIVAMGAGTWLMLRTASLRVAMLATVVVATGFGTTELAVTQIALTIFATAAFALDSLAIAGQAMVGKLLGEGNDPVVRALTRRLLELGAIAGVVIAVIVLAVSQVAGIAFTSESTVIAGLAVVLVVLAVGVPLASVVFVLDGVLIGAGDVRYLAWSGLVNLGLYVPMLVLVSASDLVGTPAVVALWCAFAFGYMGARATTLGLRAHGTRWLVSGAR